MEEVTQELLFTRSDCRNKGMPNDTFVAFSSDKRKLVFFTLLACGTLSHMITVSTEFRFQERINPFLWLRIAAVTLARVKYVRHKSSCFRA